MTRWKMVPLYSGVWLLRASVRVRPLAGAFGQLDEVLDGDGRVLLEEAADNGAFAGVERGVNAGLAGHEESFRDGDERLDYIIVAVSIQQSAISISHRLSHGHDLGRSGDHRDPSTPRSSAAARASSLGMTGCTELPSRSSRC